MPIILNEFNITKRNKIVKEIKNEDDLLQYIKKNICQKFKSINISLVEHFNKNIFESVSSVEFRKLLGIYMPSNSIFSKTFYIKRGYTEEEAQEVVGDLQAKNVSKRNYHRDSNPRCIEYYIKKGLSKEEAEESLKLMQSKNSKRTLVYWTSRGFSEEEAYIKVKEYQNNSAFIDYDKRVTGLGSRSLSWLKEHPEEQNKKGYLYYCEFVDKGVKYWKIGITGKSFEERFSKKQVEKYKIKLIKLKESTIYESLMMEQYILKKYEKYKVRTSLTTESFSVDINNIVL